MYLMLVSSRVLRFGPPFSVCTPLSVGSPFWLFQVFKPDFNTVKRKVDQFNEYIMTSCCMLPPSVSVPPFGYIRCFKLDFNDVKRKID